MVFHATFVVVRFNSRGGGGVFGHGGGDVVVGFAVGGGGVVVGVVGDDDRLQSDHSDKMNHDVTRNHIVYQRQLIC